MIVLFDPTYCYHDCCWCSCVISVVSCSVTSASLVSSLTATMKSTSFQWYEEIRISNHTREGGRGSKNACCPAYFKHGKGSGGMWHENSMWRMTCLLLALPTVGYLVKGTGDHAWRICVAHHARTMSMFPLILCTAHASDMFAPHKPSAPLH